MIDNGKTFKETYCHLIENKWYLLITNCIDSFIKNPIDYIQERQKCKLVLKDIDGINFWCLPVKERWVNGLIKYNQKRIHGLYYNINQFITNLGIKTFYYDIWLNDYNYHRKKDNIHEFQQKNYLKKRGLLKEIDGNIKHITKGMSVRESSRMSIY